MAQTTPWDIWGDFNRQLGDRRAAEKLAANTLTLQGMRDAGDAQAATTLWDRQQAKDAIDYEQSWDLQKDRQAFSHEENRLRAEREASGKRSGRQGHIAQPGTAAPAGGNKYTPQYAYNYLTQQRGVPPVLAAGIVGNVAAESGWDPAVFEGRRLGDNGTAYGAAQWRGSRQAELFKYAQSQGRSRPSFEDQLDFFVYEAQSGTDPQATAAIQRASQAKSAEEAAQIIMDGYERPADQSSAGVRRAAARSVFSGGGDPITTGAGGGNIAPTQAPQRRYTDEPAATPFPTAADQQPVDTGGADDTGGDFYAPQRAWTEEDFLAHGYNNRDLLGIPDTMDVVGRQFWSGAQLELMDPSMYRYLHPVGGLSPTETNEYLVLQDKEGAPRTDPSGLDIETTRSNAIGGSAPELPDPTVMQTAPETGIEAPYVPVDQGVPVSDAGPSAAPVGTAPTGQRTRRNAQGQLEFLVDGAWHPAGG